MFETKDLGSLAETYNKDKLKLEKNYLGKLFAYVTKRSKKLEALEQTRKLVESEASVTKTEIHAAHLLIRKESK